MKWIFRGILVIFLAFAAMIVTGYFLPAAIEIETSSEMEAYPDQIYEVLADLRNYPDFAPAMKAASRENIVFGGAPRGDGQIAAWKDAVGRVPFGSYEIVQAQVDEFVTLKVENAIGSSVVNIAIQQGGRPDTTIVLVRQKRELGGFPYLARIRAKLARSQGEDRLAQAIRDLEPLIIEREGN